MPKCTHELAWIEARIEYWVEAKVGVVHAEGYCERAMGLRVAVGCPDCSYTSVFTAYPNREHGFGWDRWPKWLLHRMQIMSYESAILNWTLTEQLGFTKP